MYIIFVDTSAQRKNSIVALRSHLRKSTERISYESPAVDVKHECASSSVRERKLLQSQHNVLSVNIEQLLAVRIVIGNENREQRAIVMCLSVRRTQYVDEQSSL